jgi:hypothetical protein
MGLGLGGMDSLSLASSASISASFRMRSFFSSAVIFCKPARCPSSSRPQGVAVLDVDPGHCNAQQQQAGRGNSIADKVANER